MGKQLFGVESWLGEGSTKIDLVQLIQTYVSGL